MKKEAKVDALKNVSHVNAAEEKRKKKNQGGVEYN